MDESQNVHTYVKTDNLFIDYKDLNDENKKIMKTIEPKDLYEKKIGFIMGFLYWLFTGISKQYLAILNSDGEVIKEIEPKVTARVLKVSKDWKGLNEAIKSAFRKDLELPENLVQILIVVAVIVLVVLFATGKVKLSDLGIGG